MRGAVTLTFDKESLTNFNAQCEAAIRNVGRGTKKATEAAVNEIMTQSMEEVPKLTATLLLSAFYEVRRRSDTSANTWAYEAIFGYGGNGDPINPVTGRNASSYMLAVHENLMARHTNGKAKFLEDPIREYAESRFKRTIFKYARESLSGMSK